MPAAAEIPKIAQAEEPPTSGPPEPAADAPPVEPSANRDAPDAESSGDPPVESKALARHPHNPVADAEPPTHTFAAPPAASPSPDAEAPNATTLERIVRAHVAPPVGGIAVGGPIVPAPGGPWLQAASGPRGPNAAPDGAMAWEAEALRQRERADRIASLEAVVRRAGAEIPIAAAGFVGECIAVPAADGHPALTCSDPSDAARDVLSNGPLAAALAQLSDLVGRTATLHVEPAGDRFDLSLRYGENPAIIRR